MRRLHDIIGNFLFEEDDAYRLEPLHRSNEVASGLTARIHDPAWALTRQWQLGEFAGQDAGSPVLVEVAGGSTLVSHWRASLDDSQPWVPYHPSQGPLDEAGQSAKLPEVLEAFGFDPPLERAEDDIDLAGLLATRVPDAQRLAG